MRYLQRNLDDIEKMKKRTVLENQGGFFVSLEKGKERKGRGQLGEGRSCRGPPGTVVFWCTENRQTCHKGRKEHQI